MTDDDTRALARAMRLAAEQFLAQGQTEKAETYLKRADELLHADDGTKPDLQLQTSLGKVGAMDPIALTMSKGKKTKSRLVKAAQRAGYTLRGLADAVGVSHAQLSSAHAGRFAIQEDVALKVQELTGLTASKKNWPAGWSR